MLVPRTKTLSDVYLEVLRLDSHLISYGTIGSSQRRSFCHTAPPPVLIKVQTCISLVGRFAHPTFFLDWFPLHDIFLMQSFLKSVIYERIRTW